MDTAKLSSREEDRNSHKYQYTIRELWLPKESTAREPAVLKEEIDSNIEEEHRKWVIEKTKNKYGVNSVCSTTQEQ